KPAPIIAKTAPYPVRHRDNISAKEERTVNRWLNRVTLSPHTSGPLAQIKIKILLASRRHLVCFY
ncbi:MAG: hypothetical protein JZU49_05385, partial [Sulfuricurvum sp.]|nr:hypothetical protein [Sulfuricurvum sp.]